MLNLPNSSSQTLETKNRILSAALKLFNEQGTTAVTTHHIAHEAGISPGNLYYHYRNKQAIIRHIFYQIEIFSPIHWNAIDPINRQAAFSDFMRFYFGSLYKYRFFFRESPILLNQDPILAKEWRATYARLFSYMQEALSGWVKRGMIRPFPSKRHEDIFIESIWILATFSHHHLEARGNLNKEKSFKEMGRLLISFLWPYHTEKGQRTLELYL